MTLSIPSPAEGPLVTFAVFTYNQERFIREAVEGAFAQTYEPLEIILSDDCSSDRTFAIMQEMVAAYQGPHCVRLVRNDENMGLIRHVLARGREARGSIVVVAAGDDISRPNRTALAAAPLIGDDDVYASVSLVDIIDDEGKVLATDQPRPLHLQEPEIFIKYSRSKRKVIQGCAATYRQCVFDIPIPDRRYNFPEDLLFSFYINVLDRLIVDVPDSLVMYRSHSAALSNTLPTEISNTDMELSYLNNSIINNELYCIYKLLNDKIRSNTEIDIFELNRNIEICNIVIFWADLSSWKRCRVIFKNIKNFSIYPLKWMAYRIFGSFPKYQPRKFLGDLQNHCSR